MNWKVILGITLFFSLGVPGVSHAKYRNGWGWSKPLNAKQGAFYTTNRRFRKDLQSQPIRAHRYLPQTKYFYQPQTIIAPAQRHAPVYRSPVFGPWR